jgi:hypothetical protein
MTRNGNNVDDDPTTTTKMKMETPATRGDNNGVDNYEQAGSEHRRGR